MPENKRLLQKIASICAKVSFVAAVICGALLVINLEQASEVYRASMGATTFFFFMVGIVLSAMGNTDIPNLKPGEEDN